MPLYVDCCRLWHINGAKKNRSTVCSKDQTLLGLAGDYSRFDLSHNVSREHARSRGAAWFFSRIAATCHKPDRLPP